jgi:O-antigen ligase
VSAAHAVRPVRLRVSQSALELLSVTTRPQRAAAEPRLAACALGFGSIVFVGLNDGGYYSEAWRWATIAFLAVAALSIVQRRRSPFSPFEWLSLGALAGLVLWMLLSASWGIAGTEAIHEAERSAVYVAALAAMLLTVRGGSTKALLAGTLAGIVAMAAYALGERAVDPPTLDPYQGALLTGPVGYANALGILASVGVLLAVGTACEEAHRGRQAVLAVASGICLVTLGLTSSRGAWLALLVGLAVLVFLRSRILRNRRTAAAVVALVGVAMVLVAPRISLGDRPTYWRVAVEDGAAHPLRGSGAGSFDDYWREHRPLPAFVRDAHSLYLETTAELGLVGLALLLCALGTPLVAAVTAPDRTRFATATAAYVAFLVHAGLDWDWEMPVTVLAGLACCAAVLAGVRGGALERSLSVRVDDRCAMTLSKATRARARVKEVR